MCPSLDDFLFELRKLRAVSARKARPQRLNPEPGPWALSSDRELKGLSYSAKIRIGLWVDDTILIIRKPQNPILINRDVIVERTICHASLDEEPEI